ncbi:ParA family protein [Chromobacterium sp. CV08]|uniref:ParA family protein n=1 Tax=Chromobacterium sp. CV08 TaxID=3133274 RepID=UPI003DA8E7AB
MASVISLFNHKGGVSKTTTAFNLGWKLASKGVRTLLVDADPQCNLTGMVMGFKGLDDFSALASDKQPYNLRDGLAPAFESRPSPIKPVSCAQVGDQANLFLLPGHIGIAEYEVTLGIAQELSGSLGALRNLPGSVRYLIDITAKKYKIDCVLVDMSPSLGPMNQNLTMTSDYFIVPMHPDYFSTMAVHSLAAVLPRWRNWSSIASESKSLLEASYPFPKVSPKFLGAIIQKYRPRNGKASRAFQRWIDELEAGLRDVLLPALISNGMLLDSQKYTDAGFTPDKPLIQMSDFNSLIAASQEHQVPIFALSDDQLKLGGAILKNTKKSMQEFDELFNLAANRLITLTSK